METPESEFAPMAPTSGGGGGSQRAEDLLPVVYDELRQIARFKMAQEGQGGAGQTLQATALVHEAYLRIKTIGGFADRAHFFNAAAEAMRRILIDAARKRDATKRGGGMQRLPINVLDLAAVPEKEEILAFDEAIVRLEKEAAQAAAVVRLRFYAGLSVEEAAETLGISARSVNREWTFARAWLFRELEAEKSDS